MTIQLEMWQLITLLLAFFGSVAGFVRVILTQIDRRLDARFDAQEKAREEGSKALRGTINEHLAEEKLQNARITDLERSTNEELQEVGERLAGVESAIKHGFDRTDVEGIYNRINQVAEDLANMKGEFRGVADSLKLIVNQITQKGLS